MKSMSGLFLPSHVSSSPVDGFMMIYGLNHLFLVSHLQLFSPTVFWGFLAPQSLQGGISLAIYLLPSEFQGFQYRKTRDVRSHSWVYFIFMMQPEASAPWGWQQTPSRSLLFAECIHQKIIALGQAASLSLCWKYQAQEPSAPFERRFVFS